MLAGFVGLLNRDSLIADVGYGTGAASRVLSDLRRSVVGIDLSPNMIAEGRRLNPGPGGLALVAFQVGDQPGKFKELFGELVSLTFYRRQPDTVALLLEDAGLTPYAGMVREPDDDGFESTPHAYLIARRTRLLKPASRGAVREPRQWPTSGQDADSAPAP